MERSKHGFVLADLPFKTIYGQSILYTVISSFKTTIANGFKWCINLYEKVPKVGGLIYTDTATRYNDTGNHLTGNVVHVYIHV